MRRAVIFDFDGTIADTVPLMLDIYHLKAETKGWPVITSTTYKTLKNHSLKHAMKWAGVKYWQIPGLLRQGRKYIEERADEINLFDGIVDLITELSNDTNLDIYVLSINSNTTISEVLRKHNIYDMVTVLPRPRFYSKTRSIKKLVKSNNYFTKDVFMVGDEVRDIDAARKAGVNSVAVSWGLQSTEILKKAGANNTCANVAQLKEILFSHTRL